MTNGTPDDWNPRDPVILKDQRQAYDTMRARCPVAHSEFLGWSLFRHEDIVAVLADPSTFRNKSHFPAIPNGLNPPEHGPYHTAIGAFFNAAAMAALEPHARAIAIPLIESLCARGTVELIASFCLPYVFKTQCAQLGWPELQWETLAAWVKGNEQVALSGDHVAGKELAERFAAQVRSNLDAHRSGTEPGADATDGLLLAEVNGKRLTDDEITTVLRNWVAGHGTTADALGIVVMHLAGDASLQQQLRQSPALISAAIEEILRVDGPLVANRRSTARAVTIGGRTIPQEASLSLMWIAANRDPDAFKDPHQVKLDRATDAGLVWGQGIHLCLGAPMARLELRVALEGLLARTQRFTLDDSEPVRKLYPGNGFAELHLCLESSRPDHS